MRFSTFSTGFSTTKGHQPYTHRNSGRSFLVSFGQKCGHSAFYKKESRRIFFAFYKPFLSGDLFFSNLEWLAPSFQHRAAAVFPCGKGGENCSFPHRKSCCSRARREQTPLVSLRSTDSPFCRCATSSPGRGKSSSGMGPLAVRKSFRLKCRACGTPEAPSLRELAKPSGFD